MFPARCVVFDTSPTFLLPGSPECHFHRRTHFSPDIVHSKNYIDELTAAIPTDGSVVGLDLKAGGMRSDETDTHISAKSLTAALAAAHTVRYAVDTVMRGKVTQAREEHPSLPFLVLFPMET